MRHTRKGMAYEAYEKRHGLQVSGGLDMEVIKDLTGCARIPRYEVLRRISHGLQGSIFSTQQH